MGGELHGAFIDRSAAGGHFPPDAGTLQTIPAAASNDKAQKRQGANPTTIREGLSRGHDPHGGMAGTALALSRPPSSLTQAAKEGGRCCFPPQRAGGKQTAAPGRGPSTVAWR